MAVVKLRQIDTMEVGDGPPSSDHHFTVAYDSVLQSRSRQLLDMAMIHENRGRPREFLPSHFFILTLLTALARRPLHATQIYATYCGLTSGQHERLGLDNLHYDQVTHFLDRVEELVQAGRIDIVDLMNGVFDWQVPKRSALSVSVDSTDYESWGRIQAYWAKGIDPAPTAHDEPEDPPAKRKSGRSLWPILRDDGRFQRTKDPDARDGHRSSHNNRSSGPFVGYDLNLAVNTRAFNSEHTVPNYIVGASLTPAGFHHGRAALPIIDHILAQGHTITDIPADRAYNSSVPKFWTGRLRELGIDPVFDLKITQRASRPGPIPGTVVIDGTLFTDALPRHLRSLPAHSSTPDAASHAELAKRYDERFNLYGYKPMTRANSKQRLRGPVRADRASSPIRCPNTPFSMRGSQDRPTTSCSEGCGCNGTVTLDDSYLPNIRQRHPYGTTKWLKDYHRGNAVESANSQLRGGQPFVRGYTRVFGLIKTAFLLGFTIFAHNHACIVNHYRLRREAVPAGFPIAHRPPTTQTTHTNVTLGSREPGPGG
ncbi:hypothetical protein [Gordonia malaquae]|uniref:hypothetical protein n=1 Tax=Gordonia malaquae TaxID=410332 RepID=UPI00301A14D1